MWLNKFKESPECMHRGIFYWESTKSISEKCAQGIKPIVSGRSVCDIKRLPPKGPRLLETECCSEVETSPLALPECNLSRGSKGEKMTAEVGFHMGPDLPCLNLSLLRRVQKRRMHSGHRDDLKQKQRFFQMINQWPKGYQRSWLRVQPLSHY